MINLKGEFTQENVMSWGRFLIYIIAFQIQSGFSSAVTSFSDDRVSMRIECVPSSPSFILRFCSYSSSRSVFVCPRFTRTNPNKTNPAPKTDSGFRTSLPFHSPLLTSWSLVLFLASYGMNSGSKCKWILGLNERSWTTHAVSSPVLFEVTLWMGTKRKSWILLKAILWG